MKDYAQIARLLSQYKVADYRVLQRLLEIEGSDMSPTRMYEVATELGVTFIQRLDQKYYLGIPNEADVRPVRGPLKKKKSKPQQKATPKPSYDLIWHCQKCGDPIADGEGYITILTKDVKEAEQAFRDSPKGLPPVAEWSVYHKACDPDTAAGSYWFDVADVRSLGTLRDRTHHLAGKRWMNVTNWEAFASVTLGRPTPA